MLRIGQVEATATQDGKYTDGSVAGGIAATRLRAAAFNAMQEELAHIVESAGLALDINDMTQVLKAIQKLTLSRANPFADIKSDGAAAISTALTNLGLDTALNNKQPKSATLTALARLSGVGNTLPYFNGVDYADLTEFTSIGRSIVGQASVAGVVDYLGLKDALNALIKTNNLSDLQNVVTSRSNLGVPKGVDKQMCAAWASFGYRNGSVVIDDGFNISSITRVRLGGYKVVFLTPLNSAKYSVSGSALFGSAGSVVFSPCSDDGADARTTTSFELSISDASDNSFKDSNFINFQVFGGV